MIDICFVILNYNLYEETMECVASIREKIDTKNYDIIIVDNASPNGTGNALQEIYSKDDDVELIQLTKNIGFAKGNNVGIKRARDKGATFICCINDDAKLISEDFFTIIRKKYDLYQPALIGPKILDAEGHVDQYNHPLKSITEYEQQLAFLSDKSYIDNKMKVTPKMRIRRFIDHQKVLRFIYRAIKVRCFGIDPYEEVKPKYIDDTLDLVLQGSCYVFTPLFFEKLGGFNEATFLYCEEEFLQADLRIIGLHSLYTPDLTVFHKGGAATETISGKNSRKKLEFHRQHDIESHVQFIKYLKTHEKEIYG